MNEFSISDLRAANGVHMIGIGGISMSAIAKMLLNAGYSVSGSDMKESPITEDLKERGAEIYIGQRAENIKNPDIVCYTAAISNTDPELCRARSLDIPVIERAELLGTVMELYKYPIAVAGTHGKTTTTSMLSLVLLEANLDPTILVGGELREIGGNCRIGSHDYLALEACEYVESFLHFKPYVSIITNVEEDHLDYFTGLPHIISSFEKFARLTSPSGCIIVCYDDKNVREVVQNVDKKVISYGIKSQDADYTAKNIEYNEQGLPTFSIMRGGKEVIKVSLSAPGEHNVLNALAVCAAAEFIGISPADVAAGLKRFGGAKRRFDKLGSFSGIDVVDDYAHHPTEIRATLETAKKMDYNNVWCVFQPHTYSRTRAFMNDFAQALSLADKVVITDIYAAREKSDGVTHAGLLAKKIDGAEYIGDLSAIPGYIRQNAKSGDLVITMGAGDINSVGYELVKK